MNTVDLKSLVRDVPDFPKPGIVFKDITPMLLHPQGLPTAVDQLAEAFAEDKVDVVVGAEARGFLIGTPLAGKLGVGFAPLRKPGKLPYTTHSADYELEYGTDSLHVHIDAVQPGQRVLLVDDLLATGGTMAASAELIENQLEATIAGFGFIIELSFLNGRERLGPNRKIKSLIQYDGE